MTRQSIAWLAMAVCLTACNPLSPTERAEERCGVTLIPGCWTICPADRPAPVPGGYQAGRVC